MRHQVTVQPSGRQFTVEADETLLDAALRQQILLPHGCKDGACGACRGKLIEGVVDYGRRPPTALGELERASGQILFCCAQPSTDLVIECKQVAPLNAKPIKTLPARIEKIDTVAPDVAVLLLRLPATERLDFHAGQYIDILLKDGRRRSFSLANAARADNMLELHIRHIPGGFFTGQVFSTLKLKDILRFEGPLGSFYLRSESDKPAILLAGGTGFAPIKGMVEQLIATHSTRSIHLYWGARKRADLYMNALPEQWANTYPYIRYIPVLSEPGLDDAWPGRTGLVHRAVMTDFPTLAGYQVYACGAPAMVDAARTDFVGACQLPEEDFFADAFTFSAA